MSSALSTAIRAVGTIAAAVLTAAAFVASEPSAGRQSATRPAVDVPDPSTVRTEDAGIARSGPSVDGRPASEPVSLMPEDPDVHVVAHATVAEVPVFAEPGSRSPERTLDHPTSNGGPLVFLAEERLDSGWLRVLLPIRPNGATGWIREGDVELRSHRFRIVVDVTELRFDLYEGAELLVQSPIAVGKRDTPTPGGSFYIKELLKPPDPGTVYGPFAFGLSGFSNALTEFAGGEGVIGIHGTDDAAAIGQRVSHGCIRLPNEIITELAGLLPLGTPVSIVG